MKAGVFATTVQDLDVVDESVLIYDDPDILRELKKLTSRKNITLSVIVPDVTRYVREMTKYGLPGMALRKIKALGPINLLRLFFPVLGNLNPLRKKDFRTILPLLVFAEYLEVAKLKPSHLFLHYQITDMALANDNKKLIEAFLSLSLKNVTLGLMTKNLSFLERKLEEWNISVDTVLAPCNANGFEMRDSQEECESIFRQGKRNYFAFGIVRRKDMEKERNYLAGIGLAGSFLR